MSANDARGVEVPEDLKALYEAAIVFRHSYGSKEFVGSRTVEVLIERIALLEKRCEALEWQEITDEQAATSFEIWNNIADAKKWDELDAGEQALWKRAMLAGRTTAQPS